MFGGMPQSESPARVDMLMGGRTNPRSADHTGPVTSLANVTDADVAVAPPQRHDLSPLSPILALKLFCMGGRDSSADVDACNNVSAGGGLCSRKSDVLLADRNSAVTNAVTRRGLLLTPLNLHALPRNPDGKKEILVVGKQF